MSARISALAVGCGLIVATALVVGSFAIHAPSTTTVLFDGVVIDTSYTGGSASIFGPPIQNGCDQTFPIGPEWPTAYPNCPTQLVGGTAYDIAFFDTGNPGNWPGLWVNLTVTAPFNFTVNPETAASIPTVPSNSTGLFEGGGDQLFDAGDWWGWALVFTFPQGSASPSGGLWLHATATVEPTNQTIGR